MKTVKTVDHLKRLALASGASVSVGSRRFNSDGERVASAPAKADVAEAKPEPDPDIEHKPEVKPDAIDLASIVQGAVDAMAASVSEIAKDNARVMEVVAGAIGKPQTPKAEPTADPAKHWRMQVNYNERGRMNTIDIIRIE